MAIQPCTFFLWIKISLVSPNTNILSLLNIFKLLYYETSREFISPMMSFFALIIVYFEKYQKNMGIGTLISTMIPYTLIFTIFWMLLLIFWVTFNVPLGPEAPIIYTAPG